MDDDKYYGKDEERYGWIGWSKAFAIFAKYGDGNFMTCASHDEVSSGPDPRIVSEEDRIKLLGLGWRPKDGEGWSKFT